MEKTKKLRKNEVLLWFGSWTSKFGNIAFDYANNVSIVSAFSGKPWILAIYQSAETMVQIAFNLAGGVKADHGNRKKIVIMTDFLAASICAALSFGVATKFMAQTMILANALLAIVYAFNSPTYKSMVKEMIEGERIGFYNSVSHGGSELVGIAGPVLALGLVDLIGTRGALLLDAATFAFSAMAETFLVRIGDRQNKAAKTQNVFGEIAEGFRYLLVRKDIFFLVVLSALVNFFLAGYNLLLPYTDRMFAETLNGFYSKALACEATGGILGSLICAKISDRLKNRVKGLNLYLGGTGISLLLVPVLAQINLAYLPLLGFVLFGVTLTSFNILFMSEVQTAVDEEYLGRVFSIIFTVVTLFMPVGSFAFSLFTDISNPLNFAIAGGGIVILSVISILWYAKKQ